MKTKKNVKFPLNNMANWQEIEKKCKIPIEYHGKLLSRPQICPLRAYGNSPLCPTGHWTVGAPALLSLHFFSNHSKQGIGYRWPCAILGWLVLFVCLFFHSFLILPLFSVLLLGSGPKGPMSCRTQGCISRRPSVCLPPRPLSDPKSVISGPSGSKSGCKLALSSPKSAH